MGTKNKAGREKIEYQGLGIPRDFVGAQRPALGFRGCATAGPVATCTQASKVCVGLRKVLCARESARARLCEGVVRSIRRHTLQYTLTKARGQGYAM